jgi:hypothetical protein
VLLPASETADHRAFAGEGPLINLQLIDEGLALALSGDHPRRSEFKAAEEAALESRRGRWQPEACGPAHPARIVISDLEPNAPGDDAQNPNGEWVELSNQGSESAPMGGWVLQDESSSHRFVFPSDFMLPPGTQLRIFSGCGDATREALYWCAGGAVWSNGGDTAYLLDPSGNVAARHAFSFSYRPNLQWPKYQEQGTCGVKWTRPSLLLKIRRVCGASSR